MFQNLVDFKDTKKVDYILESSLDVHSSFDALYVIHQLSEIKDDIQVVSQFPLFIDTPCIKIAQTIHYH